MGYGSTETSLSEMRYDAGDYGCERCGKLEGLDYTNLSELLCTKCVTEQLAEALMRDMVAK